MSFSDYEALKAAVIRWADNADVTARVDDFLALCHTRLNRVLRLEEMTTLAYTTTVVSSPWVVKPDGYMGMRRIKINDGKTPALDHRTFAFIDGGVDSDQQGRPRVYAVVADRIRLAPVPNAVFELEVAYYERVPTLSPSVTTNVFLTTVSDLLLYGTLIEAEPYLKDHEMWGIWKDMYQRGLADQNADTEAARFPDGALEMQAS